MSSKRCRNCRGRRKQTAREELYGFLAQSFISAGNVARIREHTRHADAKVRALAEVVLEIVLAKPHRRGRLRGLLERHRSLVIRLIHATDEGFWARECLKTDDEELLRLIEDVGKEARFEAQGKGPCWCGSGRAYWHCCGDRDDAYAEFLAAEATERKYLLGEERMPWWHSESGIDHDTRSAYELYYAHPDHPFALEPPEARDQWKKGAAEGTNEVALPQAGSLPKQS